MLTLKRLGIRTPRENVAYLSRSCTVYRAAEFEGQDRVELVADGSRLLAVLNLVDDAAILPPDRLGLSAEAFAQFGQAEGTRVELRHPHPPRSRDSIRRKIEGGSLDQTDFNAVIADIAARRYAKIEIAAFLVACASFLSTEEVLYLTRAMSGAGERLTWPDGPVVDKHCIGGIPGNRTSMIVVPIVAAHGLKIPKTSSRAITSPAGTADTMEVLANVDVGVDQMREVVRAANGCLIWGGHVNLSPADDILISVERPLNIDTREQMVASILSKKLAAGSDRLLIDVPVGPTAKVRGHADALRLRKLFEHVGGAIGLELEVQFTDGSQPVGRGIGPVLEARDVMAVLSNDPTAPSDLRERSILLAGRILEFDKRLRGGTGPARARELLDSGAALAQMRQIMDLQGKAKATHKLGTLVREVVATADGVVGAIDCFRIARIARLAGAPFDKGAGIDLLKKIGDRVEAGEPLYRIHAEIAPDFHFACDLAAEEDGITVVAPALATGPGREMAL